MSDTERNAANLREMDELAAADSPVHSLHPLAKLVVTIAYILVTMSFHKYNLSGLAAMALYPAVLFAVSGIPVRTCVYKMRFVLPLVCAVGVLNPFFDRTALLYVGGTAISGGTVSMITLAAKGIFCLTAAFLLAASTSIDALCATLRKLRVPRLFVTLLLLTYRYLDVMMEEVVVMTMAYRLRAPGHRGIHFSAWGSFLGQLLLRSMDRAQELYASMRLRGFDGDFWYAGTRAFQFSDGVFCVGSVGFFIVCRSVDIAGAIGRAIL